MEKTPSQLKKSYKTKALVCQAFEFVSVLLPFVIVAIVKWDEYFVQYDGTKMSIACILTLGLMAIAVWLVAKRKITNPFATLLVGWAITDFIFFLLGEVITDIALIMLFGLIGLLGAYALDYAARKLNEKAEQVAEAEKEAEKEELVEAAKVERQRVKVKIKR